MRIFSGIQPTGSSLHLGNYLGALRRFVALQADGSDCLFCIADLHAMTSEVDGATLRDSVRLTAASFLAVGIDPGQATLFVQSQVREHTELAWILTCGTRLGWLDRMTQFKSKAGAGAEGANLGLYAYPVLMAADILVYGATHVPVGEDQSQHLELARQIARAFNGRHHGGNEPVFVMPRALIAGTGARVMNLQNPASKMSKSDPSGLGRIELTDEADAIARKVGKATTDGLGMPESVAELETRDGLRNLIEIAAAMSNTSAETVLAELQGQGYAALKRRVTDLLVAEIVPIGVRIAAIREDVTALDAVLEAGAERARVHAAATMARVRTARGYR